MSVETALLCDVLDASTLDSERDPTQESMCKELARNLGVYNARMVKLMEEVGSSSHVYRGAVRCWAVVGHVHRHPHSSSSALLPSHPGTKEPEIKPRFTSAK